MSGSKLVAFALRAAWPLLQHRGETTTWRERWAEIPTPAPVDVWIHAASLGEIAPYAELLGELTSTGRRFGLTVTSGRTLAEIRRRLGVVADVRPAPLPGSPALASLAAGWRARRLVLLEAEAWPALIEAAIRHGADVAVLGGRSDRARARVWRAVGADRRRVVHAADPAALAPYAAAGWPAERLHAGYHPKLLGVRRSAAKPEELIDWASYPGLRIVGGSLHPADVPVIATALRMLVENNLDPRLLVLPRHLERSDELVSGFRHAGLACAVWPDRAQVTLVPRMGILAGAYGLGRVALIGGAWARRGGHNPLEAVAHGVPAILGPHDRNQRGLRALVPEGAIRRATTARELAEAIVAAAAVPDDVRAAWPKALAAAAASHHMVAAGVLAA